MVACQRGLQLARDRGCGLWLARRRATRRGRATGRPDRSTSSRCSARAVRRGGRPSPRARRSVRDRSAQGLSRHGVSPPRRRRRARRSPLRSCRPAAARRPSPRCRSRPRSTIASAIGRSSVELPIRRRDVTDHRHRDPTCVLLDELRAFGEELVREEPDELFAIEPGRVRPPERPAPDEVRVVLPDDPAHPEIVGRHRAVGVLPDDHESLLGSEDVHRLGAVGGDPERRARRHDRLPQLEAAPAVDEDLVRELAGEAHPGDAHRDPRHLAVAERHERERLA